jgi:monoamine oxidase
MKPCIGIIGTGIAGITAAKELVEMGHTVHVFEAKSRIGGRIKTLEINGQAIDMGAAFLWGDQLDNTTSTEPNPLTAIINHLTLDALANVDFLKNSPIYDSRGRNIQSALHAHINTPAFRERMEGFVALHQKMFLDHQNKENYIDHALPSLSELLDRLLPEPLSSEDLYFKKIINISFLHKYGADAKWVSLWNLCLENSYPGKDYLASGTFSRLVHNMLQSIKENSEFSLFLNTAITSVERTPNEKQIILHTEPGKQFTVDRLLITVPLGVLKANQLTFYPALSPQKQVSISALEFGKCNKVLLHFNKIFWPKEVQSVLIFNKTNHIYEYLNVDYFSKKHPYSLVVTLYGKEANFTKQSDKQIIEKVLHPLKNIYPVVSDMIDFSITRWESDPYTQGAFTYLGPNATPKQLIDMASPEWEEQLFFAGEHTDQFYYGSVHGAYLSGLRASQSIDNSLHPKKFLLRTT